MIFQLLILSMAAVAAFAAPSPNAPTNQLCFFTAQIKEICRYNDKFINKLTIHTEARIPSILSPNLVEVKQYSEDLNIDRDPLIVYVSRPEELIAGQLEVARPNNTGDVQFQWTYALKYDTPITEKWTESNNGKDDDYACFPEKFDKEELYCDAANPGDERTKYLNCLFKCNNGR
ncbi:hypothetical protein BU23DRAFT_549487 [Bimuria novae-zelandiae CBS 107.79]|uniref:Uncharacterized protein n=1 Tax=Bimuria novae-zelandiae CBS 107.79 TaxID=1447943 RepID=A0A6A5VN74_9PLEO|nr:hypothetical protein BU23DRAFT_549487 [Bimuria novae-zelandiae CBS 107.79]